jgi:hypothetical protein
MISFRRSPYFILLAGLLIGLLAVILDVLVDYFFFYEGKTIIDVLARNVSPMSIWSHGLLVLSYVGFSVVVYFLQKNVSEETGRVDSFLFQLLDSLKSLRYNLYNIKMAIHVARYGIEPPEDMLTLVEQRIEKSVCLIDAYLSGSNGAQEDEPIQEPV